MVLVRRRQVRAVRALVHEHDVGQAKNGHYQLAFGIADVAKTDTVGYRVVFAPVGEAVGAFAGGVLYFVGVGAGERCRAEFAVGNNFHCAAGGVVVVGKRFDRARVAGENCGVVVDGYRYRYAFYDDIELCPYCCVGGEGVCQRILNVGVDR